MTAGTQQEILLKVEDLLVRRGGATVLDIRELSVFQGQVLVLIGPNGAGKSTLLLSLAGLLKSARGRILFRGDPIADGGFDYRRHIAMVFQEPLLFDTTVFENVAAGLKIRGVVRTEIERTVPEYLERFGIGHLANAPPGSSPVGKRSGPVSPAHSSQNRRSSSSTNLFHHSIRRRGRR